MELKARVIVQEEVTNKLIYHFFQLYCSCIFFLERSRSPRDRLHRRSRRERTRSRERDYRDRSRERDRDRERERDKYDVFFLYYLVTTSL